MPLFRSKAEAKVADAGYDPARLPPGQYLTEKWPVLHAGSVPEGRPRDLGPHGHRRGRERRSRSTWESCSSCRSREVTVDIHCVTRWSRFDTTFKGVHWSELAKLVAAEAERAASSIAHAEQGFTANVPIDALEDENALIAYEADGEPLTPDHGWPLRLVVPTRYFWKSAKWLRGIELARPDQPGFWERYGYHNDADYWKEERYAF